MLVASSTKTQSGDTVVLYRVPQEKVYVVTKTTDRNLIKSFDEYEEFDSAMKKYRQRVWEI